MENHGPHPQPNGILPRPASQSRRPIQQPQNVQMLMEQADLMDDDEDFGIARRDRGPQPQPQQVSISSNPSKNKGNREREVSRFNSRDKDAGNSGTIPKFLKIAVIGDSTVGKTCLCNAITLESYTFNKNYHLTCGVNVYPKAVKVPDQIMGEIDPSVGVERLNMALLDSSGKDIYLDYLPKYWELLDGFVLVVDLTNATSLANAEDWVKLAINSCPKNSEGISDVIGVLIGNKMDLSERRKISPQTAQEFAVKHNLQYFECSVKENSGLEEPFFFLAHKYITSLAEKENVDGRKVN